MFFFPWHLISFLLIIRSSGDGGWHTECWYQGKEGGMPVGGEKSLERGRGQLSLVPVSFFQKLCQGPRTFDFLPLGFGGITSDNQHTSQKRLISYCQSLNRRILFVISPEWLLRPWWIFKPFLLESTWHFPNPFTISTCHGSWEISETKGC